MSRRCMGMRALRSLTGLLFTILLCANAGAAPPDEVGGVKTSDRDQQVDAPPPPLDLTLRFTFGRVQFNDQDMSDTYGGMNGAGAQLAVRIAEATWFYMATGYAEASGNPYYDSPGFDGGDAVTVRTVPLRMGIRDDMVAHPDLAIWWGVAAETSWIREEIPSPVPDAFDSRAREDGWGFGLWLTFGPEYLWSGGDKGVGIEAAWGGSGGEVARGERRHDVNLSGVSVSLYLDWAL